MANRSTNFRDAWLNMKDSSGNEMKIWLRRDEKDGYRYCILCKKSINVKSGGFSRIKDHSEGEEHKKKLQVITSCSKISTIFPVTATTKKDSTLSDKVLDSEITWCLFSAFNDLPHSLCDDIDQVFDKMFPDSEIPPEIRLKRQKASYFTSFGISTYINDDIINNELKDKPYCLLLDEGSIKYTRKWLAILVRHLVDEKVVTDFLGLRELGTATAEVLAQEIKEELKNRNLSLKNCLAIMCDSANVMRGAKGGLIACLKKEYPQIVDIGGCCMHHVHNSASSAMSALGHELEDILDEIFIYLRYAKSAREFEESQRLMDLKPLKFLRRIETRWLQIYDVLNRLLELYIPLQTHMSSLCASTQRKGRVKDIRKFLDAPDSVVYINFALFALKPFKQFELIFQTSKPVIHILHERIIDLISTVSHAFIRPEHVEEFQQLNDIASVPLEKQLPDHRILIGDDTRKALRNDHLTAVQTSRFYKRVREFYGLMLKSLIHYLPVSSGILRSVQFIDLTRKTSVSEKDILKLKKIVSVSGDDDEFLLQWRQFLVDNSIENASACSEYDLPCLWKQMKAENKYPLVVSIAERAMILPHGNAETERIFSLLKRLLTSERNRLQDKSLNGIMSVKTFMHSRGYKVASFPIDGRLRVRCMAARSACMAYLKKEGQERRQEEKKREDARKAAHEAEEAAKKRKEEDDERMQLAERKRKMALEYMETAKRLFTEAELLNLKQNSKPSSKSSKKNT